MKWKNYLRLNRIDYLKVKIKEIRIKISYNKGKKDVSYKAARQWEEKHGNTKALQIFGGGGIVI